LIFTATLDDESDNARRRRATMSRKAKNSAENGELQRRQRIGLEVVAIDPSFGAESRSQPVDRHRRLAGPARRCCCRCTSSSPTRRAPSGQGARHHPGQQQVGAQAARGCAGAGAANLDGGGNTDEDRRAKTPLPPSTQQSGTELEQAQKRVQALEASSSACWRRPGRSKA
jgi:hypothetical protein